MNKVAVGAAALVVVAGGGVGFAAWSGGKVAKELQAQTDAVLAPFSGIKVVENSVKTGLFSSTHTVTLDIGCTPAVPEGTQPAADTPAPKPMTITWHDHVKHGPLPGGRSLGLAAIDTELVLPPHAQAQVAKVFGDQAPLKAHTVLGFGGNYVTEVTSPPLKYAEAGKGDIDWQGLRIVARGKFSSGTPGAGSYTFEAPGLTANFAAEGQGAGSMKIGRMALEGSVTPQPGGSYLLSPSTGHGTIASLSVATTPPGGKPVDLRFENLVFDSTTQVDNGLLSAGSSLSMTGRVDDFPIDKIEMKVALKRLHAATYQQLIGRVMQQTFSCTKPTDEAAIKEAVALQENVMKDVGTLLTHNPEYALERLAVVIGGKTAEMSYSFGTQGVVESDAQLPLPMLMTSKGYANAAFKVDNAWIEQVVKKAVALQPAEGQSPEETATMAMTFIQASIDGLVQKGLVAREGDTVVSKAAFEGGMLKVNGQPMPLGAMMGGGH